MSSRGSVELLGDPVVGESVLDACRRAVGPELVRALEDVYASGPDVLAAT